MAGLLALREIYVVHLRAVGVEVETDEFSSRLAAHARTWEVRSWGVRRQRRSGAKLALLWSVNYGRLDL